jgi:multidrug resistance efflux pump
MPGRVETVAVVKGHRVEAGQVLAVLETDLLEADVAQAEAAVAAARAQVALVQVGPHAERVAVAQAQVAAAEAALAQAELQQARPDLGVTQAEIAAAQAQVATTMGDQLVAEEIHDLTMTCVDVELGSGKVETICPVLGPYEEGARYSAEAAGAALVAAQAQLDALMRGRGEQARAVEAAVETAAAQRDVAQTQLDAAQRTASAEQVAVAQVAVSQAEAARTMALAALDQATLRAPTAGTIVRLDVGPGEAVMPGQAILTMVDLERMRVETTDLSELDIARVAPGQRAEVYMEALEVTTQGRVVRVVPQAELLGGDVVYRVIIELGEQPPGLRWGMSVEVEIATD